MTRRSATLLASAILVAVLGVVGATIWHRATAPRDPQAGVPIKLRVPGARESVRLERDADGAFAFVIDDEEGPRRLSPDQLAARLWDGERDRDWLGVILNITSPIGLAWVALGLLGQLLFTGRMLVQWISSERAGRSIVPPVFWWMSLGGASMLLAYFLWRGDIVGILGQGLGWVIYARNLVLLKRSGDGDQE